MNKDFYISLYSSISKTIWILLLTTIVIEGYLIQRCFQINSIIQEKIIDLDNAYSDDPVTLGKVIGTQLTQTQQEPMGFKINYGTLSVLWPIILFSFFIVVQHSLNKRVEVLRELSTQNPDFALSNLRLDLFSFFFSKKRDQSIFIVLLFYALPIIGLLFHAYSGYYMVDLIHSSIKSAHTEINPENQKLTSQLNALFIVQVVTSLLFLSLILLTNVRSSRDYRTSANMVMPKTELT